MTASEVTDLPEPLSPTRQTVSPWRMVTLTLSSIGLWSPPVSETLRSRISRTRSASSKRLFLNSIVSGLPLLQTRVEKITRGIAEKIDRQDAEGKQKSGPEDQGWLDLKVDTALGHDVAPGRYLGADAGAEEGQDGFDQDCGGADIGTLDNQRRQRVRHQVLP